MYRKNSCAGKSSGTPPYARIASILDFGAKSGIRLRADTPKYRPDQARAWAVFPELVVLRPAARLSEGSDATALKTPRNLNDPIGCKHSGLRRMSRRLS
jgi:hypothetical protein